MVEDVKAKIVNKIGYGVIAGVVAGVVNSILEFLVSSINLGKFDDIESVSQQFLGTTAGNPNILGWFILNMVVWIVFGGITFGIIIYLLMTRAGWERDLTRYLTVAIVLGVVFFLLNMTTLIISMTELDLLVDGLIILIIFLTGYLILALTVYYLEERFESASETDSH
ncbi:MAG: hypothetical protein ACW967_05190 [Candidatus Hodarchaeales archaeon]